MVIVSLGESLAPREVQSSKHLQVSGGGGDPDRESTLASTPDRESTTLSRVSHLSRQEMIEELEAVEAQLHETTQERETWKYKCHRTEAEFRVLETQLHETTQNREIWKSKCHQTEAQVQLLQRETSDELKALRKQTTEEIDSLKSECQFAEGQLAGLKRKLTPQLLGVAADEVEAFLKGPEPTHAEQKVGSCLTNRKFVIFMLYANLVCGAVYLYVFMGHQDNDEEFITRPTWLIIIDWIFCVSFVLATLLRLLVFRLSLRGFWNVFEFTLLPLFIIEQALSANSGSITDELILPRNTFQSVRVLFVFKLVPVLTREFKAWRKPAKPPEPHVTKGIEETPEILSV